MEDMENLTAGIREIQIREHKMLTDGVCKMRTTGGSRRQRKRTKRGERLRRQCREKWMALKRKRVYNNARPNPRGRKADRLRNWKEGTGAALPFTWKVTDVTGRPFRNTGNSGTPVGYSEQAALRRKQCDTRPDSRNSKVTEAPTRRLLLGNDLVNTLSEQRISTRQYWRWRRNFLFKYLSDTCRAKGIGTKHKHGNRSKGVRVQE
jgi:hypothetical protein